MIDITEKWDRRVYRTHQDLIIEKIDYEVQEWIASRDALGKYSAENFHNLNRFQIFNWIMVGLESGEIKYEAGRYFLDKKTAEPNN